MNEVRAILRILNEISAEAARAAQIHPETEDVPDGTRHGGAWLAQRAQAQASCDRATRENRLTFAHVLEEEFYEALCEEDKSALRKELVQVAAVCLRWIQKLDKEQNAAFAIAAIAGQKRP